MSDKDDNWGLSVEHGFDFVIEGLIVQIINFNCLEIFLGVEVAFSDQEGLSQH